MKELKPAILLFVVFTVICGGIYPAIVTGIASLLFPGQAGGSLVTSAGGQVLGSSLIGQPFTDAKYFWPRPSATAEFSYDPMNSGGSNLGPTNPDFIKTVAARVRTLRDAGSSAPIPVDLVEASGSGLDPHISTAAAEVQVARVAAARGMDEKSLAGLVASHVEGRQLGVLGQDRVNVLLLNLALDGMKK
ncbi:MAG: potassium-transporting ATPase subunit KdpC [Desulfocapsaceae bacterium]|nr:potassium-transporting ATPase subunit KdpC [Desulfocapsaceae bacterium]